ncbi:hypothetical protein GGR56DRAFT_682008 [Xylariaceae sp. FL0804]|nr:hypothetical protein GGR56DRAFT_682008 [Xylariaceae sp. FL0804]
MIFKASIAAAALGAAPVTAFWRMECRGETGLARIDPIESPGEISGHTHSILGSGGFSVDADFDSLRAANCTSCIVTEDKSAYWTPPLYFYDYDTQEFTILPQVGGMLAYYFQRGDNVTAFPEGFRMIAGNNWRRNYTLGNPGVPDPPQSNWLSLKQTSQSDLAQRAVGYNCLDYSKTAEASLWRHYLPDKSYTDANCPDGLRLELMFPSCWNGELDSSDHQSHVAYPDLVGNGDCPSSHPQRLVTLFYETIWNTADSSFADKNGEFVISNGDPTGFGYHGDFISGWDSSFLQDAVDTCTNESGEVEDCSVFTDSAPMQSYDEMNQCTFEMPEALVKEDDAAAGLKSLPGNIAIQSGPQAATAGTANLGDTVTSLIGSITGDSGSSTVSKYTAPSLSYSPATSSTDGVFVQSVGSTGDAPNVQIASTTSQASTSTAPMITTAPVVTSEPGVSYEVVSTQTLGSGADVEEIVWEEPVVYVTEDTVTTVTVSTPQRLKNRQAHAFHHRRHGHR